MLIFVHCLYTKSWNTVRHSCHIVKNELEIWVDWIVINSTSERHTKTFRESSTKHPSVSISSCQAENESAKVNKKKKRQDGSGKRKSSKIVSAENGNKTWSHNNNKVI